MCSLFLISTTIPANVYAVEDIDMNEFSYTEVISPQYDDAKTFSEELAAVKRGDKWGYINELGEVEIGFQYDRAYSFSEGKALVEKHVNEDGFVNRYYYIITPDNRSVQLKSWDRNFYNGDFYFKDNGGWLEEMDDTTFYNGYILVPADSPNGTFVFDQYGQSFDDSAFLPTEGTLSKYNHYSAIDQDSYVSLYEEIGFISARPFNQGMAPVVFEDSKDKNGRYLSFLKKDGTLWSGPRFYDYYVYDILASYQVFNDNSLASIMNSEGKWGAINKEGRTIIPFDYDVLKVFTEGVASFSKNGKYGFIDIHGKEVIQAQFDDTSIFKNGLAAVRQGNSAYIIDMKGNKVKGTESLPVNAYFKRNGVGNYIVTTPSKYVVITKNNKYGIGRVENVEKVTNVTGVSLDHTKLELKSGEVAKLPVTVSPLNATNKKLSWSSSNEKVAVVDAYGYVTAQSAGITTIIATTEDGKHTATSEVLVGGSTSVPDPYKEYSVWGKSLTHNSTNHSWTIKLNMNVDENSVDDVSVYIVDKEYNKVDFIHAETKNSGIQGQIILENNGNFKTGEEYWIIIEDTVKSIDGKKLKKGLKAPFTITN